MKIPAHALGQDATDSGLRLGIRRSISMLACLSCLSTCDILRGDDLEFFEEKIRPILVDYCYECHSSETDEPAGGLLVDTKTGIREGGETGPAVVPEDLDESLLISAIEYRDLEMPPEEKLDEEVIADFRKWIEMGAPDPREDDSGHEPQHDDQSDEELWSLRPVDEHQPPDVVDSHNWCQSDLDRFVMARLHASDLTPSPPATPQSLLRRITFDLVGLPPSPDLQQEFEQDSSPDAVRRLVDRLLASQQFGERWGRHWLDVVRYGESAGSSRDVLMLYSWKYRDYVIDSLNNDTPYVDFIRQQIAGDLLPFATEEQRRRNIVATGLLAIGSKSLNGGNLTLDIADDQIDVVSKSFLGLTVSCARCHDHKFDPIPTADYYALAGIFRNSTTYYGGTTRRPASLKDQMKVYRPLSSEFESRLEDVNKLDQQLSKLRKKLNPVRKRTAAIEKRLPKDWKKLLASMTEDSDESAASKPVSESVRRQLKAYQQTMAQMQQLNTEMESVQSQLEELPRPDFAFAVRDVAKPKNYPIQIRGEKSKPGSVVERGFLSCVDLAKSTPVDREQSGRLQLAEWITDPSHPLTSRVMVNRVWQHLLGRGLVASTNNFGLSGSRPTHPLLLDWLAHRFQNVHQGSIKALVREIVLSHTYQQTSQNHENGWDVDPDNRLYWRANRRRLEAEAIRDAMLSAAGTLDLQRPVGSLVQEIGEGEVGRNINTAPLDRPFFHRSVYLPIIRGLLPEFLKVFDFPEPSNPASERTVTNVPTQSLFLLNSPFVQQQASDIARMVAEFSSDRARRIEYLWRRCLGRFPTDDEIRMANEFLEEWSQDDSDSEGMSDWAALAQSLLGSAEFRFIE